MIGSCFEIARDSDGRATLQIRTTSIDVIGEFYALTPGLKHRPRQEEKEENVVTCYGNA